MTTFEAPGGWFRRLRENVDWVVLSLTLGIITIALINLDSASGGGWDGRFVADQIRFVMVGAVAMGVTAALDYRLYFRLAYPMYAAGLALVVLVTLVGITTNSATR